MHAWFAQELGSIPSQKDEGVVLRRGEKEKMEEKRERKKEDRIVEPSGWSGHSTKKGCLSAKRRRNITSYKTVWANLSDPHH